MPRPKRQQPRPPQSRRRHVVGALPSRPPTMSIRPRPRAKASVSKTAAKSVRPSVPLWPKPRKPMRWPHRRCSIWEASWSRPSASADAHQRRTSLLARLSKPHKRSLPVHKPKAKQRQKRLPRPLCQKSKHRWRLPSLPLARPRRLLLNSKKNCRLSFWPKCSKPLLPPSPTPTKAIRKRPTSRSLPSSIAGATRSERLPPNKKVKADAPKRPNLLPRERTSSLLRMFRL